jgi:hypothetical protein
MRRQWMCVLAIGIVACGKHGDAAGSVAKAPSHSGDVWEVDKVSDRKEAPATVLAFVNGLHTVVLDGSDVYAGSTRYGTSADTGGGRIVALSNGLSARIVDAGDAMELRFSSGERVPLRKQTRRGK